jgi:ribonuclease R
MFNSQVHRSLWLTLAAAALFTAAGCTNQATNEPVTTAKKAAPAKPAAAKAAAAKAVPAKAAAAKPAVKPAAAKAVPAKAAAVNKAPEPTAMVTVPKGTEISATVGQTLATDKNKVGDTFAASLTSPIQVEGKTVIPKGAQVTGRIVKVKKNELKVTLASVVVHGKSYELETNSVAGSKNQAKSNAKDTEKAKANKDVTVLAAHSQVKFKLAKPITIPVKG